MCLTDMGEACMELEQEDESKRLHTEALAALTKALDLTNTSADSTTKAQYHKAV